MDVAFAGAGVLWARVVARELQRLGLAPQGSSVFAPGRVSVRDLGRVVMVYAGQRAYVVLKESRRLVGWVDAREGRACEVWETPGRVECRSLSELSAPPAPVAAGPRWEWEAPG